MGGVLANRHTFARCKVSSRGGKELPLLYRTGVEERTSRLNDSLMLLGERSISGKGLATPAAPGRVVHIFVVLALK